MSWSKMLAGMIPRQKLTKAAILIMPWGSDQPRDTFMYQMMMMMHSLRNNTASSHLTLQKTWGIQSCWELLTSQCCWGPFQYWITKCFPEQDYLALHLRQLIRKMTLNTRPCYINTHRHYTYNPLNMTIVYLSGSQTLDSISFIFELRPS